MPSIFVVDRTGGRPRRPESLICGAILALGLFTTSGWILHSPAMVSILPGFVPMVFDTGLSFVLAGVALGSMEWSGAMPRALRMVTGSLLVCLCGAILLELLFNVDLRVDLPSLHTWYEYGNTRPGRMAPNSAIGFVLVGAAILLTDHVTAKPQAFAVVILTFAVLIIGLTGLAGYLLTPDLLFGWSRSARMAVHTATGLILCATALWLAWCRSPWYASRLYFHHDEKIRLLAPVILVVFALTAGLSGFVVQQKMLQSILGDGVETMLRDRTALFSSLIAQRLQNSLSDVHLARLEEAGAAALAATPNGAAGSGLRESSARLILEGIRGIVLQNGSGATLASYGRFEPVPVIAASLDAKGATELIWDEELVLRLRLPIVGPGSTRGTIILDRAAPRVSQAIYGTESLGRSVEFRVCVLRSEHLQCFPAKHHTLPFPGRTRSEHDLPLPMELAIGGRHGRAVTVDSDGHNVIAAYGPLAPGLGLVVKEDTAELYAPIRAALGDALLVIMLIALLGAMLSYFQLRPLAARMLASEAKANDREQQVRAVVDSVGEGILTIDEHGLMREVNPAACEIFGYESSELIGHPAQMLMPSESRQASFGSLDMGPHGGMAALAGQRNVKISGLKKDGSVFPLEITINEMILSGRRLFVGVMRNIADRSEAERKLTALGQHDSLTGLPNRMLFLERLSLAALRMGRTKTAFALMFLDLDGFKDINDRHGHQAGDELLIQIAGRLSAMVRKTDTVARLGGDEFTIILEGLVKPRDDARAMARKLMANMQRPFFLAGREVKVTTSLGLVIQESASESAADLLARADAEMYAAKRAGKNCISVA